MRHASRWRVGAVLVAGAWVLAACTGSPVEVASSSALPSSAPPSVTPSPTATPVPPLAPGVARGRMIFVQQAEDAALVAGAKPIRLTLARTGGVATWITSPSQKLTGTMSTEQAMLNLGWRPADDGTTASMRTPRPNGLLAHAGGTLAFTIQRANVRPDGTLVLDIRPMTGEPETVESFGPVSLTMDGVPGVIELGAALGQLTVRVIVTGKFNEQAVIQVVDPSGQVVESAFLSAELPPVDTWIDVTGGDTVWSDPVVTFTAPTRGTPGTVRVIGTLTIAGTSTPLDQVIARWSLPLN